MVADCWSLVGCWSVCNGIANTPWVDSSLSSFSVGMAGEKSWLPIRWCQSASFCVGGGFIVIRGIFLPSVLFCFLGRFVFLWAHFVLGLLSVSLVVNAKFWSWYFSVNIYVDLNLDLNRLSTPYKFCSSLSTVLIGNPVDIGLNCFESLRVLLILIYRKTHTHISHY